GGSDQWGNITVGVDLIRRARAESAYAITTPLVTRPDGTKFGKSESDALYLDAKRTSPYTLYQYFVRADDSVVASYLRYFTFLDHDEIIELDEATEKHPEQRAAQRALAHEVVSLVHGAQETAKVERAAEALYTEDIAALDEQTLLEVFSDVPSSTMPRSALDGDGLDAVEAFSSTELSQSKSAARTAISQGGAYVNNRRLAPDSRITSRDLIAGRYVVLRRGRREHHLLRFE
ncbi:MAG TPA: tyrosine--tRNA ligase, partial [Acidimicrobiales bacterium]|nr:tyrosine--tRNA ligase [Acidimicrobiales bacterium]